MSKHQWIVFGTVCLGALLCVGVLVAKHMISSGFAVVLAIGVCALAAVFTIRSKNNGAQSSPVRRLIYIYVAFGLLASGKALIAGWTTDDAIGLTILLVILTALVIVFKQRRNPSSPR
jgi:hypothetical protein